MQFSRVRHLYNSCGSTKAGIRNLSVLFELPLVFKPQGGGYREHFYTSIRRYYTATLLPISKIGSIVKT